VPAVPSFAKAIKFASSPAGRKVLKEALRVARSEEGRKLIAQARKVADTPEGKRLLAQAKHLARVPAEVVEDPKTASRLKALRERFNKSKP
jgi:hypothetical protein